MGTRSARFFTTATSAPSETAKTKASSASPGPSLTWSERTPATTTSTRIASSSTRTTHAPPELALWRRRSWRTCSPSCYPALEFLMRTTRTDRDLTRPPMPAALSRREALEQATKKLAVELTLRDILIRLLEEIDRAAVDAPTRFLFFNAVVATR